MKLSKLIIIGLLFMFLNQILSQNNQIDSSFDISLPSIPTPDVNMPIKPSQNNNKDINADFGSLEEFSNKILDEVPGMVMKGTNTDNEKERLINEKKKLLESERSIYKGKGYVEPYRQANGEMPRFAQSEINFFGQHPNNHFELPSKFSVS